MPTTGDLTVAVQDYLRAIYALESAGASGHYLRARDQDGVKAPSATAMTKRLAGWGSSSGCRTRASAHRERQARSTGGPSPPYRLLERYLADRLGFSIDEVHAEADRLEHALSEELEAKIDEDLGYPTHDPHGDPIPDRKLRVLPGAAGASPSSNWADCCDRSGARRRRRTPSLSDGARARSGLSGRDRRNRAVLGPITVRTEPRRASISRELAQSINAQIPGVTRKLSQRSARRRPDNRRAASGS